ncbi:MAG: hypothetical protein ACI8QZ_000865 [Chlamydiales bacterium]|jgi:hypothetical protein
MSTLRSFVRSSSCLALLLAVGACYQLPKARGYEVEVHAGGLADKNPRDVAIAPVLFVHEDTQAPDWALRKAFQKGLVLRRYSPLALEQVDENLIEASYTAGRANEDALLEILVYSWDQSQWDSRALLNVDLEARLIDPAGSSLDPLWAGRLVKTFQFTRQAEITPSQRTRMQKACDEIAAEILAVLPARAAVPGR